MRGGLPAPRAGPVLLVPVVFVVTQVREANRLLLLELGAVADVMHKGVEDKAAAYADGRDRHLDRELAAVPVERHELDAPVEDRALAMAHELLDALPVSLAVSLGDDRVGERTTDRLLGGPAEGPFGGAVPAGDVPGGVHRHERIVRRVDDLHEAVLALAHPPPGLLPLADAGRDSADSVGLTLSVAHP